MTLGRSSGLTSATGEDVVGFSGGDKTLPGAGIRARSPAPDPSRSCWLSWSLTLSSSISSSRDFIFLDGWLASRYKPGSHSTGCTFDARPWGYPQSDRPSSESGSCNSTSERFIHYTRLLGSMANWPYREHGRWPSHRACVLLAYSRLSGLSLQPTNLGLPTRPTRLLRETVSGGYSRIAGRGGATCWYPPLAGLARRGIHSRGLVLHGCR